MTDTTPRITLRQLMRYLDNDIRIRICKYGGDADDFAIFKLTGGLLAPYLDCEILGINMDPMCGQLLCVALDIPEEEAQNG